MIGVVCPAESTNAFTILKVFFQCGRCIILLKVATAIREYCNLEGVYWVCSNVGGTCQSNIYMNAKTQGLPAEHYTEHPNVPIVSTFVGREC